MNATRAKSAAGIVARAVQNAASTATNQTNVEPVAPARIDLPAILAAATADKPLGDAPPILQRLTPSTRFHKDLAEETQAVIGASAVVGDYLGPKVATKTITVWLPAAVWQGIATIISHTPDEHRAEVATFLEVLHASMHLDSAMAGLLAEVADEVRRNPYASAPVSDQGDFDYVYS